MVNPHVFPKHKLYLYANVHDINQKIADQINSFKLSQEAEIIKLQQNKIDLSKMPKLQEDHLIGLGQGKADLTLRI
jgi:hypothetical protein